MDKKRGFSSSKTWRWSKIYTKIPTWAGRQEVMSNIYNQTQVATVNSDDLPQSYLAYLAGGLFTQHDLGTNVALKEAVWRLSKRRFVLLLPQSKELRQLDVPDLPAYLRNVDLHLLVQADILIARFDGTDIDSGTIVEFMVAKMLGKPTVILRSDSRHLSSDGLDDPYNLMMKNWPRTIEVHIDSHLNYLKMLDEEKKIIHDIGSEKLMLEAEHATIRRGIETMAGRLIEALNSVVTLESPYPPEYRELVYEAVRYAPGSGFDQLFTEQNLRETLQKLTRRNTL